MVQHGCLLLETSTGWRTITAGASPLRAVDVGDASVAARQLAQAVHEFVTTWKLDPRRMLIAPSATSTFFATFPADELGKALNRNSLTYHLEDVLPFDAEDIVADFQIGESLTSSLCIEKQRWSAIVAALEDEGLLVQSIVPAAILACQSLLGEACARDAGVILWHEDATVDLFRVGKQQLLGWQHLPAQSDPLRQELTLTLLDETAPKTIVVINGSPELHDVLETIPAHDVRDISMPSQEQHAARDAGQILRGKRTPWFELRRGALTNGDPARPYRGSLVSLYLAAALMLLTLTGACWWRAQQLRDQLAGVGRQQADVFESAFPGTPVPSAVLSRLSSEHTKVVGSRRVSSDLPVPRPALDVLYSLLQGLPDDVRFRLTEIQIENGELRLDIELRNHSDAGKMAGALESQGFRVVPPSTTQREDQAVQSRLEATWVGPRGTGASSASLDPQNLSSPLTSAGKESAP